MPLKKIPLFLAVLVVTGFHLSAQTILPLSYGTALVYNKNGYTRPSAIGENDEAQKVNLVKLNLTGLVVKNITLQYERVLNKKLSAVISFRVMPRMSLPFKSVITDALGDNLTDTKDLINNMQVSNFAVTPEFRIYFGKKGYGRGFYIAPFYRYTSFLGSNLKANYTTDAGTQNSVILSGKLTTNTAGILFGAQWAVGKHLCIDWSIAGPHYGGAKGDFSGVSAQPLSAHEQNEIRIQLDDVNVPFAGKTVKTSVNGASMNIDGPWGGVRAGVSLGFRF